MLDSLIEKNQQLIKVEENLFQIIEGEEIKSWLGIGTGIGYGGELNIALKLDTKGNVQQASLLSIKDTSSYVTKVIESGLVNKILGTTSRNLIHVDGISGATLTSNGILQGVNDAADPVRQQIFDYQLKEQASPLDTVDVLDGLAVILFWPGDIYQPLQHHSQRKNAVGTNDNVTGNLWLLLRFAGFILDDGHSDFGLLDIRPR